MKHAKSFAGVLIVVVSTTAACWKASSGANVTFEPTPTQQPVGGTTPAAETKYFSGSIGDSLQVQMRLLRRGDQLSGSYFYQKVGTKIDLRGTIDQSSNLVLDEFDPRGKQTGNFQGKWVSGADGQVTISGNWSKPNSQSKTPFSLEEQPVHFAGDIEIQAKQIKQSNKNSRYEIFAAYPELTGAVGPNHQKFNRDVRNLIQKKVTEFRKDVSDPEAYVAEGMGNDLSISYVVGIANGDLISIEFDVGSYYSGAAHPNSYSEAVNYDLKNGKTILLGDLFKPGTDYLKTIAAYCIKDLKQQSKAQEGMLDDDWIEKGAGANAENYESWTITKKGLAITFDAYQVGPYAAGPQHVVVPYSVVKDIVAPTGLLAKFAK